MRVIRHLPHEPRPLRRVVLTLGNFDGVHLGHRAIVERALAEARASGGQVAVLTFEPHPLAVLVPDKAPPLLQSLADRLRALRALDVDVVVLKRFTRAFAALTPEEFVREMGQRLELRHVVVGPNVSFGRNRAGTVDTLRTLGGHLGFAVDVVGPVMVDGKAVSSTFVRQAVGAGDMRQVRRLLGRTYALRGRVVQGERRGRTLGFPTANLLLRSNLVTPPDGVYAVLADLDGRRAAGVLNIGVRPTFAGRRRTVEVHVLDFVGDLYGRVLAVEVIDRLRGEMTFAGPEALRAAISADVARARQVLARESLLARSESD
jgi:riboflavin kinase/FMN adenylyltransferase